MACDHSKCLRSSFAGEPFAKLPVKAFSLANMAPYMPATRELRREYAILSTLPTLKSTADSIWKRHQWPALHGD